MGRKFEYAEFLGIDPVQEPHLLWIAREGVVAQVPPPWKACTENGDDVFYFNFETGDSVWDHPCDEKYKELVEEERHKAAAGHSASHVSAAQKAADVDSAPLASRDQAATTQSVPDLAEDSSKRLELITNEISDEEELLSPKSQPQAMSPLNDSLGSSNAAAASQLTPGRGSAGVGLAPAGNLGVASCSDKNAEAADRSLDSVQSSPNQSRSGGRVPPLEPRGATENGGGKSALEHSGASGQNGLSEISEDFPSDFDEKSEVRSQHGKSLELSATIYDDDLAPGPNASSVAAVDALGSKPASNRLGKLQGELASLARVLGKFREIRGHQHEYLQMLQAAR